MRAASPDSRTPLDQATSLRIDFLRIVLIAGIVVLHTPPTWSLQSLPTEAHHWPGVIKLYIEFGPLRAGVPMLALISGYLLVLRPYRSYATLVRRKLTTLLLPFLIWNACAVALRRFHRQEGLVEFPDLGVASASWLVNLNHLLQRPPNFPTYFLIDLFMLALLSPLITALLRRAPLVTLVTAGFAAVIGYGPIPGVRPDVALGFMAGAACGNYRIDPRLLDRYTWPILLGFLALSVAFIAAAVTGLRPPRSLGLLRAAGVPAVWVLSGVLAPTASGRRLAKLSGYAFILFCAHAPALKLLASVWPKDGVYWVFYAVAAPLVIGTVLLTAAALKRWGGPALALLSGARIGVPALQTLRRPHRPRRRRSDPSAKAVSRASP